MAKSFQYMYRGEEAYWYEYTGGGTHSTTMDRIRNDGGSVMTYRNTPDSDPNGMLSYDNMLSLRDSGGRLMVTMDNYRDSGVGHAMAGRTVKYVPNKRLDIIAIDPRSP